MLRFFLLLCCWCCFYEVRAAVVLPKSVPHLQAVSADYQAVRFTPDTPTQRPSRYHQQLRNARRCIRTGGVIMALGALTGIIALIALEGLALLLCVMLGVFLLCVGGLVAIIGAVVYDIYLRKLRLSKMKARPGTTAQ